MTLDEAIKHAEESAKDNEELYRICPVSESGLFHCDGTKDCKSLKNGENKGCRKCAEEHMQIAEWLKELKVHIEALQKMKNHIKSLSNDPVFGVKPHLSISEKEWSKDSYIRGFIDVVDIIDRYLPELDIYDKNGGAE